MLQCTWELLDGRRSRHRRADGGIYYMGRPGYSALVCHSPGYSAILKKTIGLVTNMDPRAGAVADTVHDDDDERVLFSTPCPTPSRL